MRIQPRFLAVLTLVAVTLTGSLARAQTAAAVPLEVYRLTARSTFEEGCFAPCLCPVHYSDELLGTFRLTPGQSELGYRVFDIKEVNWLLPDLGYRVTGSGTYRIGGGSAPTQQLQLDLKVADRAVEHYDSGVVPGGSDFPAIDLTIARNGMVCHDTVFHVAAVPALPIDLAPFALYGSSYDEGCFGPCDCAVRSQPLLGRFDLLKLLDTPEETSYAVLNAAWFVRTAGTLAGTAGHPVSGYGIYRTLTAAHQQRMVLDLLEDGAGPTRFDSGLVAGGGNPRRVDVDVAASGFACYDRVYSIHARRKPGANSGLSAVKPEPVPPVVQPVP